MDFDNLQEKVIAQLLPGIAVVDEEKRLIIQALINLFNLEVLNIATEKLSSRDLYLFMGATTINSSTLLPVLSDKVANLEDVLLKRIKVKFEKLKK